MIKVQVVLGLLSSLLAASVLGQTCGGFTDVEGVPAEAPFCNNIEWLKNRSITLGCGGTDYCPAANVRRDAMAAFMNRLGAALSPTVVVVDGAPPTFTLQVEMIHDIVCKTTGLIAAAPYPRLAVVHGHTSLLFDAAGEYGQRLMYSTDSSVSFAPFDVHSQDGSSSGVVFANASSSTALPLVANTQYDFGIGLFSISGSATTTTKLVMGTTVGSHCQLMVEVFNQDGTSSPF
jgi:hypothetical protein